LSVISLVEALFSASMLSDSPGGCITWFIVMLFRVPEGYKKFRLLANGCDSADREGDSLISSWTWIML